MKFLVFPLIFLLGFTMLSMLGIGTGTIAGNYTRNVYATGINEGWFDTLNHKVCNETGEPVGENGHIFVGTTLAGVQYTDWVNSTGSYGIGTYNGEFVDEPRALTVGFDIGSSIGLIAIVVGITALAALIGFRFVGSGESTFSVKVITTATFFTIIWGVLSVLSLPMITQASLFGAVFYFFLTFMYVIGIVQQMNGGTGDE